MRYRHRVLCLLTAIVVGLMAFAATAQALKPQFLINKKPGALAATVSLVQVGSGSLSIPTLNLELKCETITTLEGMLNSSTDAKGKLLFEKCTALSISTKAELPCSIIESEGDPKPHVTGTGLLLPAELQNGEPAVLVEQIVSLVRFKSGTGCPLPLDNVVTGELCLKVDNNDTVEPTVLASQAIQKECRAWPALEGLCQELEKKDMKEVCKELTKEEAEIAEKEGKAFLDKMLYGTNEIVVNRTIKVSLTGAHTGMTFGVSLQ